jgi:hypothetical protein
MKKYRKIKTREDANITLSEMQDAIDDIPDIVASILFNAEQKFRQYRWCVKTITLLDAEVIPYSTAKDEPTQFRIGRPGSFIDSPDTDPLLLISFGLSFFDARTNWFRIPAPVVHNYDMKSVMSDLIYNNLFHLISKTVLKEFTNN